MDDSDIKNDLKLLFYFNTDFHAKLQVLNSYPRIRDNTRFEAREENQVSRIYRYVSISNKGNKELRIQYVFYYSPIDSFEWYLNSISLRVIWRTSFCCCHCLTTGEYLVYIDLIIFNEEFGQNTLESFNNICTIYDDFFAEFPAWLQKLRKIFL